ncbi:TraC family protein, partial [Escherichia coli]
MTFSLFRRREEKGTAETRERPEAEAGASSSAFVPPCPPGAQPLRRPGQMTRDAEAAVYHAGPSVIDFLPWVEYLDEEQCLLLDDGVSVGAVYSVTPAATEGRTEERLAQIRDMVEDAL